MDGTITTSKLILDIILAVWCFSLARSVVIMIGGKKIFKKARKGEKTALYPIINLFTMLEIAEISSFWGILFFVPFCNIIVLTMMSYKLGTVFKTGFMFKLGLVICPLLFYPILGLIDKPYKVSDEEYFKAMDNARGDSINLMTEDDIQKVNQEKDPNDNVQIDSIFKSDIQVMEKAAPYKAARVDVLDMTKIANNTTGPTIEAYNPNQTTQYQTITPEAIGQTVTPVAPVQPQPVQTPVTPVQPVTPQVVQSTPVQTQVVTPQAVQPQPVAPQQTVTPVVQSTPVLQQQTPPSQVITGNVNNLNQ